jgi:hypothetical protein
MRDDRLQRCAGRIVREVLAAGQQVDWMNEATQGAVRPQCCKAPPSDAADKLIVARSARLFALVQLRL